MERWDTHGVWRGCSLCPPLVFVSGLQDGFLSNDESNNNNTLNMSGPSYLQRCHIAGVKFSSRIVNAPAPFAANLSDLRALDAHPVLGGVVTKTMTLKHRNFVNPPYICHYAADGSASYNVVGLRNWGLKYILHFKPDKPWMLSLAAKDRMELEAALAAISASQNTPDFVELNLSCPNVSHHVEFDVAMDVIQQWPNLRYGLKVAPGVRYDPERLDDISSVSCSNTLDGFGGVMLRPYTMRAIEYYAGKLKIPVVACGGVRSPRDAEAYLTAGATLVAAATAPLAHRDGPLGFFDEFRDARITGLRLKPRL